VSAPRREPLAASRIYLLRHTLHLDALIGTSHFRLALESVSAPMLLTLALPRLEGCTPRGDKRRDKMVRVWCVFRSCCRNVPVHLCECDRLILSSIQRSKAAATLTTGARQAAASPETSITATKVAAAALRRP
jgi:hypothetical protein